MSADRTHLQGTCPECGAPLDHGLTCWQQFGTILTWEWQDPELQAVHFLTVAAYNLQHPARFTAEALATLHAVFVDHIDHKTPVDRLRKRVAHVMQGHTKVLAEAQEREVTQQSWPMTVADVYNRGESEGAAGRVRQWAMSVRSHLPPEISLRVR